MDQHPLASPAPTTPHVVVVTGSESTGKTTLARRLAERFGVSWVPEFSRAYAESLGRPLGAGDVKLIARGTVAAADAALAAARAAGHALVVLDTDLASTLVYAAHYYELTPPWVVDAWRARMPALYLLCHPDVPWEPDGVRDRPAERAGMHDAFAARLAGTGASVADIAGRDWAAREADAVAAVTRLLGAGASR